MRKVASDALLAFIVIIIAGCGERGPTSPTSTVAPAARTTERFLSFTLDPWVPNTPFRTVGYGLPTSMKEGDLVEIDVTIVDDEERTLRVGIAASVCDNSGCQQQFIASVPLVDINVRGTGKASFRFPQKEPGLGYTAVVGNRSSAVVRGSAFITITEY